MATTPNYSNMSVAQIAAQIAAATGGTVVTGAGGVPQISWSTPSSSAPAVSSSSGGGSSPSSTYTPYSTLQSSSSSPSTYTPYYAIKSGDTLSGIAA